MKKATLLLIFSAIISSLSSISIDSTTINRYKGNDSVSDAAKTANADKLRATTVSWDELISNPGDYINSTIEIYDTLYIVSVKNWNKYGEVTISNERLMTPTDVALPGSTDYNTILSKNNSNKIIVSDGSNTQYPNPRPWAGSDGACRAGSYTTYIKGKFTNTSFGYTITPTNNLTFQGNERPTTVENLGEYNLKVCSFNLEYYLATNYGEGYGPDNETEAEHQHNKIIKALQAIDADIFGFAEVQQGQDALAKIVNALNENNQGKHYAYIDDGTTGNTTFTKVGFVYRDDLLNPIRQIQSNNTGTKHRKKAQGFTLKSNNESIVIMLNHFKAKSGSGSGDNADMGDGQGIYNGDRKREATAIVTFANSCKTYFGDADVIIMGDLNSYSCEDPIRIITDAGYTNMIKHYGGEKAYSFVFNENAGCLDHALVNASLAAQTTGCQVFHINADESAVFGYDGYSYQDNMYRCSDHDPVVIGFNLNSTTSGSDTEYTQKPAVIYGENNIIGIANATDNNLELFDINGKLLYKTNVTSYDYTLDLSTLVANGVYIIRLTDTKGNIQTLKLIK